MGRINVSPNLLKKLIFLSKHSSKVLVAPNSISSRHITIQIKDVTNCTFGIESKELVEMLKNTQEFELINDNKLEYSYSCNIGDKDAMVSRKIQVFDLSYTFDFLTPLCTIKLPIFKSVSVDETTVCYMNEKLILETNGYVKTRIIYTVQRVEGAEAFNIKVRGCDLKIIEEIEGDRVLCFFENSLVVFGFDKDITTAVVIKCII